jgi:hypothetical protein
MRSIRLGGGELGEVDAIDANDRQALLRLLTRALCIVSASTQYSFADPTLHSLPSHLVEAVVVGRVEDVFLVGRLGHSNVADIVNEEARACEH